MMDQLVDFAHYEDAVKAGGATLMVRVRGDGPKSAVVRALEANGGHFINYYGRFATEEISPVARPASRPSTRSCAASRQALTSDSSTRPSPRRRRTSATSSES